MPTYESQCKKCGKHYKQIRRMIDSDRDPICCGEMSTKIINWKGGFYFKGSTGGGANMEAYKCPVTDQVVTSPKQRRNIEAEHEITVVEPGMFKRKPKEKPPELPDELKPELQPALDQLAKTI